MSFTDPESSVPRHTDDVRLRMLAHIVKDSLIRSVSVLPDDAHEATHICSDIRSLQVRNRDRSWKKAALECDVFILDYYWIEREYFSTSASDATGYGQNWFSANGQVVQMLGMSRQPSTRVRAVLLPNDVYGCFESMYAARQQTLRDDQGIGMELLTEADARQLHPLVIATLRAERETSWAALKKTCNAYHRYEVTHSRKYLNKSHPFMLVYSSTRSTLWDVSDYLKHLTRS
ncbi:hypothetical protein JKP88DRAFT_240971 [Tribonema minus]|uniref:Uncharacterized protein n=1 Tax=Tribonema minus TaxID=303371 RepID=A0A835YVU0_9STRA|nr:hypothetical protein JKP88DRAFT_255963 [Tribonema minus]KAG5186370.1 hypothetical protein JKP88DRAFT_240971 [Tribonema minus]